MILTCVSCFNKCDILFAIALILLASSALVFFASFLLVESFRRFRPNAFVVASQLASINSAQAPTMTRSK